MASFEIITDERRAYSFGNTAILDAAMDSLPATATQAQIDARLVEYITGDLRKPKTMKTVRAHLLAHWHHIAPLAERAPELFDSIILEVAELATCKP